MSLRVEGTAIGVSHSLKSETLDFSEIVKINEQEILNPLERKTGRNLKIVKLTEVLGPVWNESDSKIQKLVGSVLIFQLKIYEEINKKSEKYKNEGYSGQGFKMAFFNSKFIFEEFKQAIEDPENNLILLVIDQISREIVGRISLLYHSDGRPIEAPGFYLAEELRGDDKSISKIGLDKYLFSMVLFKAKEIGCKEVFLRSRRKGGFEWLIKLYKQFGFVEIKDPDKNQRFVNSENQNSQTIAMKLTF